MCGTTMRRALLFSLLVQLAVLAAANAAPVNDSPEFATVIHGSSSPQAVSNEDALWQFFSIVNALGAQRPGADVQLLEESVGLAAASARALAANIADALTRSKGIESETRRTHCESLRAATTDEAFVAILTTLDSESESDRVRRVDSVLRSLDVTSIAKIHGWVDASIRPKMHVVKIDYAKLLSSKSVTREQLLIRACQGS